jgi:polyvinyl alcohol dehydrogenase (cytochrome)
MPVRAWVWSVVTIVLSGVAYGAEPPHPGSALYATHCAACHDQPTDVRTPDTASLRLMSGPALRAALTQGVMQPQAASIPRQQLMLLIDYLAAKESDSGEWLAGMLCAPGERAVRLDQSVALSTFGVDLQNSRHMTAPQAGLTSAGLADLELAWAIGFPDTTSLRSAPVIIGRTMFYTPTQTNRLLALDVDAPCVKWVYDAGTALRTSLSYGTAGSDGRPALIFADQLGRVHAVDPRDGMRIWMVEGRHTPAGTITGTPVPYGNRIIVPVSASGVGRAADPTYECCAEHGAVVALDAATGRQLWTYHTMEDAQYTGRTNRLGVRMRGPSGAPIWSTPSIDAERGVVYATTGQNTSLPATDTSDAVLAIDLETGELRWGFQALANDVWNMSCRIPWERSGPNCPSPEESVLKDFDFGAGAVIVPRANGRDILLAGQKSGDVWALDSDTGRLLWNTRFGQGTPLGGIHWGLAIDGERVFAPINDPDFDAPDYRAEPGMNALRIDTGEVLWRQPVEPDCSDARRARFPRCHERYGLSAAPLVVDASVIAGTLDGRLFVYDAATGAVAFQYDTLRDFDTVNGVPGKGGSIDAHSLFAGAGMVFVGSGYASFGQAPGNVLLAFRPRPR